MYQAIVAKIKVRPHPNADRLQCGNVLGYNVICGMDITDDQLGVLFLPDGQLSEKFVKDNRLDKAQGGYLEDNRRVKSLRLRGEKSEGLWLPITCLATFGAPLLLEGQMFTEINGEEVCRKYETPRTRVSRGGNLQKAKPENMFFKKHFDTPQWRFFKDNLPDNAYVTITEKLHGTSGRYGKVLTSPAKTLWQRILSYAFGVEPKATYEYQLGTRNIVLDADRLAAGTSYYRNEDFRFDSVKAIELYNGEVLYYELVGYHATGPIMPEQPVKDKELVKKYGPSMAYRYGQMEGSCGLYVYRITRTSPDGVVTELSWNQVKQRCNELSIKHVPELDSHLIHPFVAQPKEFLEKLVEQHTEGQSILDHSHIREGVVIRVESASGTSWYKNKSFDFGVLEGYIKDSDAYVDMEESS